MEQNLEAILMSLLIFVLFLRLSLIQEGQLSHSGEGMCTSTGQLLRG